MDFIFIDNFFFKGTRTCQDFNQDIRENPQNFKLYGDQIVGKYAENERMSEYITQRIKNISWDEINKTDDSYTKLLEVVFTDGSYLNKYSKLPERRFTYITECDYTYDKDEKSFYKLCPKTGKKLNEIVLIKEDSHFKAKREGTKKTKKTKKKR